MNVSEANLTYWAAAPGQTEQARCDNAVTAVKKAINASPALNRRNIRVFAQGSYCNRTNVPRDSDVDICVLCTDTFHYDLPTGKQSANFGIEPASYTYPTFKNEVGVALRAYFGAASVNRGKKAYNIRENSYRVDADAVPCFEYRQYWDSGGHRDGVCFFPDGENQRIENYPEQNYQNGVAKNDRTGKKFKDVVRILKTIRYNLKDDRVAIADKVPSFLVESLVWNVPDSDFNKYTHADRVRAVLYHIYNHTRPNDDCSKWTEVNDVKYLFYWTQPWTAAQANEFVVAVWNYIGYK